MRDTRTVIVNKYVPIFMLLLVLISYGFTGYTETIASKPILGAIDKEELFRSIIGELMRLKGIDVKDTNQLYMYLLGGRILRFKANDLCSRLIGLEPYRVFIAAYVEGIGWINLPTRIYNPEDLIEYPLGKYYILPEKIGEDTIIEFRLPDKPPLQMDPVEKVPIFGKGARNYYVLWVRERQYGIVFPIYIIIDPEIMNEELYSYEYDYLNEYDPYDTYFPIPSIELIHEYRDHVIKKYGADVLKEITRYIMSQPIPDTLLGFNLDFPETPIPDGGGGSPMYNVLELRPVATRYMEEHVVTLTYYDYTYTFNLYLYDPSRAGDAVVYGYSITFIIEAYEEGLEENEPDYIKLYMDNSLIGSFTVYGDRHNQIIKTVYIFGQSTNVHYVKAALFTEDDGNEWKIVISPHVKLWYSDAFDNDLLKTLYLSPSTMFSFNNDQEALNIILDTPDPISLVFWLEIPESIGLVSHDPEPSYARFYVKSFEYNDPKVIKDFNLTIYIGNHKATSTFTERGQFEIIDVPLSIRDIMNHAERTRPIPFIIKITPLETFSTPKNVYLRFTPSDTFITKIKFRPLIRIYSSTKFLYSSVISKDSEDLEGNIYRDIGVATMSAFTVNTFYTGNIVFFGHLNVIVSPEGELETGNQYYIDVEVHMNYLTNTYESNDSRYVYYSMPIDHFKIEFVMPWAKYLSSDDIVALKYDPGSGVYMPEPPELPPIVGLLIQGERLSTILNIIDVVMWGYSLYKRAHLNTVDKDADCIDYGDYHECYFYFEWERGTLEPGLTNDTVVFRADNILYGPYDEEGTVTSMVYITIWGYPVCKDQYTYQFPVTHYIIDTG